MKDGINLSSNCNLKSDEIRMMKLLILIAVIISIILQNLMLIENQLSRFMKNIANTFLLESIVASMNYNRY